MAKRSKEEQEEERKKELLRTLRRGPDLDWFIDEQKRTFVSYAQGARMYSMNYYSFVKLAKEAGANIRIKKNVVIDLELIEKFLGNNCEDLIRILESKEYCLRWWMPGQIMPGIFHSLL